MRRDIADIALADLIFAPHYARADQRALNTPSAMLLSAPDARSEAVSQLLHGERFAVLDIAGGWAWGYCGHDHYVGYLPASTLGEEIAPTHVVTSREAPLFFDADIKSAVAGTLSLGARVGGTIEGDFIATPSGHLHVRHIAALGAAATDPVAVAEALAGAPYLWGGRGAGGIDCSGLVQLALGLTGIDCPRDSDQQRAALGTELSTDAPLRRGDLIFFPGHVGMMVDDTRMIHANAWWMAVTTEPLADVVARLRTDHAEPILARKRLNP